ncbi:MAG: hypothetical protein JWO60_2784, partial [Frankiales bacterium]|nr:hypothetical protein [Frankiales bacterium]
MDPVQPALRPHERAGRGPRLIAPRALLTLLAALFGFLLLAAPASAAVLAPAPAASVAPAAS